MLNFAAITPHTPLLIPTIGKENLKKLSDTVEALGKLANQIEKVAPDTIVIISSHATKHQDAFSINLHDEYHIDLSDFGDMSTSKDFAPDLELITQIQRATRSQDVLFTLDSISSLDYGTAVPLWHLTQKLPDIRIVPLSYSGLTHKEHVKFGNLLKEVIDHSPRRIAVVASGDLSHCLTSEAPAGFHKEGEVYDTAVQEAVKNLATSILLSIDEDVLERAQTCLHEQLLILFGILERKRVRPEILSYEAPFGVGYLVAQFHFENL